MWQDEDFDKHHAAVYYLRVLEVPTPRWSTLLANRRKIPLPKDLPEIEQQRGWSSPISFVPSRGDKK